MARCDKRGDLKLICFPYAEFDGPANMALDELLWSAATEPSRAYFRIYGWLGRPWVSLGYFQDAAVVRSQPGLAGCPCVRRLSGGGLIVHDNELTYAMALPAAMAPDRDSLYRAFHEAVQAELARLGIDAQLGPEQRRQGQLARRPRGVQPPLCFARRDPYGLYVNGFKVLGSAQRRSARSVLMHGSLILGASAALPSVPGLRELTGKPIDTEALRAALELAAAATLQLPIVRQSLPQTLLAAARQLADSKYRHDWRPAGAVRRCPNVGQVS